MTCNDTRALLPEYLRKKLDPALEGEVAAHCSACPECRAECDALAPLVEMLAHDKPWQPPQAYWSTIVPAVLRKIEQRSARRLPVWTTRFVVPVSAAVVLVVGMIRFLPGPAAGVVTESNTLSAVPGDALMEYYERQSAMGLAEPAGATAGGPMLSDDAAVLREIVVNENLHYYTDSQSESVLDQLSTTDADLVASRLESETGSHH